MGCTIIPANGGIDEMTIEQTPYRLHEVGGFCDSEQRIERRPVVMLARETGIERTYAERKILRPCRIVGDQVRDRDLSQTLGVRLQRIEQCVVRV